MVVYLANNLTKVKVIDGKIKIFNNNRIFYHYRGEFGVQLNNLLQPKR